MNREAWLAAAVEKLTPLFTAGDWEVPTIRVSVGFPGGRGKKAGVIGQCWPSSASADETPQIFVHPSLTEIPQILGVLAHEMAHAIDDCESGHKGTFVKIIRSVGLVGKPTCAAEFDGEHIEMLAKLVDELGEYPHAALGAPGEGGGGEGEDEKKQSTRMLKVECPRDGYIVRTTRKWLEIGTPSCPCGSEMEVAA